MSMMTADDTKNLKAEESTYGHLLPVLVEGQVPETAMIGSSSSVVTAAHVVSSSSTNSGGGSNVVNRNGKPKTVQAHERMQSVDVILLDQDALDSMAASSSSDSNARKQRNNNNNSGHHHKGSSSGYVTIPKDLPPRFPIGNVHVPKSKSDGLHNNNTNDKIRLGICAMDKKARSKPMAEILSRLDENLFQVQFFGDDVILNQPIEDWPVSDVLIAFFSKGYPLPKVKEYVALRRPLILNDLDKQELLQDRRRVYDLLEASGIDVPKHIYVSRDGYVSTGTGVGNGSGDQDVQEFDDHIVVNGVTIHKPFVEKPVNAEDHNISIYYPTSAGGGCKKLFRKVGNRSSEFYPDINEVRREGSYIYEAFVETQGTDVKMYTVGPEYGHAEARKSPAVDGKVERNSEGKEVRFPVILTFREKEIARRIVLNFKQFVCGFDILRVQEGHSVVSYVCDVNGWSFVKNSRKYYDDCAQILSEHMLAHCRPSALTKFSTLDPLVTNLLDEESVDEVPVKKKETFLARAARMLQGQPAADDLVEIDNRSVDVPKVEIALSPVRSESGDLLSTAAATLEDGALPVREFPNNLTSEPASMAQSAASSVSEDPEFDCRGSDSLQGSHQEELRCVISIIRHADRTPKQKVKLNLKEPHILQYFHDHVDDPTKDLKVKAKAPLTEFLQTVKTTLAELGQDNPDGLRYQLLHMRDVLERWKIVGLNRKLQIKPRSFEEYIDEKGEIKKKCTEVQLILKWGGNLTKLGETQSVILGKRFRHELYPDAQGGGILRLHSTFRHDLKIKTSDEGRVMKTAAAFAKGLLELEGDLPPILVSLVHKEKGSMHMLDPSGNKEVKMELDECKAKITANLQRDIDVSEATDEELEQLVGPKEITSLREALALVGNPRKMLFKIYATMGELIGELEEMLGEIGSGDERRIEGGEGLQGQSDQDIALSGVKLYKGETLLELTERWRFIYTRFYDFETEQFDLSRIPDVLDNVRFDVLHNPHLGLSNTLQKLYDLAKPMADCVVPQEYGTTIPEKRSVGVKICHGLLEKIKYDFNVASKDNEVDMRYLINMDYSADLNINSMGRRIRTRLYFTSESHLHTVLNVLRFASVEGLKPLLSDQGITILNSTPEVCYLTQIIMRVFEDARRSMDDPRRFRVEILFSPGANATPSHIHELDRENDTSRFDTARLQMISRDGLTCQDVQDFFENAIMAGRSDDDDDEGKYTIATASTARALKVKPPLDTEASAVLSVDEGVHMMTSSSPDKNESELSVPLFDEILPGFQSKDSVASESYADSSGKGEDIVSSPPDAQAKGSPEKDENRATASEDKTDLYVSRIFSRKYFWGTVAVGSMILGVSCLFIATRLSEGGSRSRRRWTQK